MISSPDTTATRSRLADWIELVALTRGRAAGEGDLAALSRLTSDDNRERARSPEGDLLEEEILESELDRLVDRVTDELGNRADTLRENYPFTFERDPLQIGLRPEATHGSTAHVVYVFNLLMTAALDHALPKSKELARKIDEGRRLFHACASVGVAGLINRGHTFWFGFPRPDKSNFSEALGNLSRRLGFARQRNPPPPGLPDQPKDDQVDVVGWRQFSDSRMGTLFVICQAATGAKWDDKSIIPHLLAFCDWFEQPPYALAMASLAIPFPAHHDVDEVGDDQFELAVYNALKRLNHRHGIVIDRLRITEAVTPLIQDPNASDRIAGLVELNSLRNWINETLPLIE
jgi:hypothetical protein